MIKDVDIRNVVDLIKERKIKDPFAFYAFCPNCKEVHVFHKGTKKKCKEMYASVLEDYLIRMKEPK